MKEDYPLLKNAPAHDTEEFLQYLRDNNVVVHENDSWLIIENCKYPWLTAFHKPREQSYPGVFSEWWEDISLLWKEYGNWKWVKKSKSAQTIPGRFHIHLIYE